MATFERFRSTLFSVKKRRRDDGLQCLETEGIVTPGLDIVKIPVRNELPGENVKRKT
jgi:hypothetical protein